MLVGESSWSWRRGACVLELDEHLREVVANEAIDAELGGDRALAFEGGNSRGRNAQLAGQLARRNQSRFDFHAPLPSMASAVLVVRRSRTTSETDLPVVADLVASHVISSVVRSSIGKGIVASCMAMHDKYAIACIRKEKNARKVIFYFGYVTEGCIFRA